MAFLLFSSLYKLQFSLISSQLSQFPSFLNLQISYNSRFAIMVLVNSVVSSNGDESGSSVDHDDPVRTGGGQCKKGKFSFGYASAIGNRHCMEDLYETRIGRIQGKIFGLFGVFDGHGGIQAAKYLQKNLFSNLINHPNFITDTKSAIEDAFNHTDTEFLKVESEGKNQDSGSAALTAILLGNRLIVANVGDSRAVICRDGNAIALSRDHKPDVIDEQKRIEDAGGFVVWCGAWRVCGVLALSRAFGNRFLKQFVVADPEIQETIVDSSLEFLILASDGLWDVITNEEAVGLIRLVDDPKEAARRLMVEAYRKGSSDNITCLVVRFLWDECGGIKSSSLPTCQCDGASSSGTSTSSST